MLWQEVAYVAVGVLCSSSLASLGWQPLGVLVVVAVTTAFLCGWSEAEIRFCHPRLNVGGLVGSLARAKRFGHVAAQEPYRGNPSCEGGGGAIFLAGNGKSLRGQTLQSYCKRSIS